MVRDAKLRFAPHHEEEYADSILKQRIDAGTPLHPARFTRERVRGKRALRNATVFVCRLLAEAYRLAALSTAFFP
jgi:hypothetical protein